MINERVTVYYCIKSRTQSDVFFIALSYKACLVLIRLLKLNGL